MTLDSKDLEVFAPSYQSLKARMEISEVHNSYLFLIRKKIKGLIKKTKAGKDATSIFSFLNKSKWAQVFGKENLLCLSALVIRGMLLNRARYLREVEREVTRSGAPGKAASLLAIDQALKTLEGRDPLKSKLVELRFYAGLKADKVCGILNLEADEYDRHWFFAKAWLLREIASYEKAAKAV